MSARQNSYQADPAATRPDLSACSTFRRHPVAYGATLLVIAAVTMSWTGFDIEPASAGDQQSGAVLQSTIASNDVDARDLLDDPQREQPWPDQCANSRRVAPTACAAARPRAGD